MTMIDKAPQAPAARSLSDLSRFRSPAPAAAVGSLTPFLAPPAPRDRTPVLRASDCGEQAMRRLRHPFAPQ